MKLVPLEKSDENEVPAPIPDVPANFYGDLFFAADWSVLNTPWKTVTSDLLFEVTDATCQETWQGYLNDESAVSVLVLVRKIGAKISGAHNRLEIQFVASDFLQGHDYELNVRYAPESWDACERDVIVLRAFEGEREPEHPNMEQVKILTRALKKLQEGGESVPSTR